MRDYLFRNGMPISRAPLIIIFFVFIVSPVTSQPKHPFTSLSCPEKRWVILHPFVAKKAYRLSLQAKETAASLLADTAFDGDENGGQVDAFRHAYWMALLSQQICWKKARSLGRAHEKGNYRAFRKGLTEEGVRPDSVSGAMDLFNNARGLEIGRSRKAITDAALRQAVRDSVLSGRMKIIRKDVKGIPVDCNGNVIDVQLYRAAWALPKCLVASDEVRKSP
jgi:hypothetical protein